MMFQELTNFCCLRQNILYEVFPLMNPTLGKVGGFLWFLWFPQPIQLTENIVESGAKHHNPPSLLNFQKN
jgi:hypothetical protein